MKLKALIVLFFVFCFLFPCSSVSAIGVGANPSFLDLELELNQLKETEILVYNIAGGPGIFQVFPDEFGQWIKIEPDSFKLEAGENKVVRVKIFAERPGQKKTNLSILAVSLDRASFNVGAGIKIPLNLNVKRSKSSLLASALELLKNNLFRAFIMGFVICLSGFFLIKYLYLKKQRQ